MRLKRHSVLPGFGLTLGMTMFYTSLIVLVPLSALFFKTATLTWDQFWTTISDPRVVASYRLTLSASFVAALVNAIFGFIVAWVLVRYRMSYVTKLADAVVDLPFALPTAVSGIALANVYSEHGWIGRYFYAHGIQTAYSPIGITIALTFIGLPFVVRTLQPAIEELEHETEEAAASLGANRWQTFSRIILPALTPSLITGFALAFARALGEYGSVVFISSSIPMKTEITSLLIMAKLEQFDYPGATSIAVVMLVASFVILLTINGAQWWFYRKHRGGL
jgi:sulfate transport system permease protein